jgi:hypothetical protein
VQSGPGESKYTFHGRGSQLAALKIKKVFANYADCGAHNHHK